MIYNEMFSIILFNYIPELLEYIPELLIFKV